MTHQTQIDELLAMLERRDEEVAALRGHLAIADRTIASLTLGMRYAAEAQAAGAAPVWPETETPGAIVDCAAFPLDKPEALVDSVRALDRAFRLAVRFTRATPDGPALGFTLAVRIPAGGFHPTETR